MAKQGVDRRHVYPSAVRDGPVAYRMYVMSMLRSLPIWGPAWHDIGPSHLRRIHKPTIGED